MKIKLPIVYYNWVRDQKNIIIGTPEWQEWLATRKSFNYQDASGSFTCKQRNNGSWMNGPKKSGKGYRIKITAFKARERSHGIDGCARRRRDDVWLPKNFVGRKSLLVHGILSLERASIYNNYLLL
ncbi:hypothetical protein LC593_17155 [Nostoc sp. CHAB 5844]|nr:hypothetical protein [Nostoc sp. CHAB 5844]